MKENLTFEQASVVSWGCPKGAPVALWTYLRNAAMADAARGETKLRAGWRSREQVAARLGVSADVAEAYLLEIAGAQTIEHDAESGLIKFVGYQRRRRRTFRQWLSDLTR